MAENQVMEMVTVRIAPYLMAQLEAHLFPGDGDEHGAVIAASVLETDRGTRLLAHRLFLAQDGIDYVAGQRGYRMLTATFVMDAVLECVRLRMAYIAVHCHGGVDAVGFSPDDNASHERGYPALLDILDGLPAGALVFAHNAVAGDIWLPGGVRARVDHLVIAGHPIRRFAASPPETPPTADDRYDRQVRLFGDRGQRILRDMKVGVIGAGGAGSLVVEYLSRLGVGDLVVVDPDRVEPVNLSRIVGSRRLDTLPWLTHRRQPRVIRELFERLRTSKVRVARRVAKQASRLRFVGEVSSIANTATAELLRDCDYLFLAADSMQARLVFNALVHQYLIPGVQMGAKAQIDVDSGEILDLFVTVRPLAPGGGCLWCNGLIDPIKLQEEATSPEQRRRQRYVDDADVAAPSVISLNAVAASLACDDFLMSVVGLMEERALRWIKAYPRTGEFAKEVPRRDQTCRECSEHGRVGRGPTSRLPTTS